MRPKHNQHNQHNQHSATLLRAVPSSRFVAGTETILVLDELRMLSASPGCTHKLSLFVIALVAGHPFQVVVAVVADRRACGKC